MGTPFVFVGGHLLPENFTKESTQWLQQAGRICRLSGRHGFISLMLALEKVVEVCYNAGAQFMEPPEGTSREAYSSCSEQAALRRYQHDVDHSAGRQMAASEEHRWSPLVPRRCRPDPSPGGLSEGCRNGNLVAGMAKYEDAPRGPACPDSASLLAPEDEHADPARNLYNEMMSAPGTVRHDAPCHFDGHV